MIVVCSGSRVDHVWSRARKNSHEDICLCSRRKQHTRATATTRPDTRETRLSHPVSSYLILLLHLSSPLSSISENVVRAESSRGQPQDSSTVAEGVVAVLLGWGSVSDCHMIWTPGGGHPHSTLSHLISLPSPLFPRSALSLLLPLSYLSFLSLYLLFNLCLILLFFICLIYLYFTTVVR